MLFARKEIQMVAIELDDFRIRKLRKRNRPVRVPHEAVRAEAGEQLFHLVLRIEIWVRLFGKGPTCRRF